MEKPISITFSLPLRKNEPPPPDKDLNLQGEADGKTLRLGLRLILILELITTLVSFLSLAALAPDARHPDAGLTHL